MTTLLLILYFCILTLLPEEKNTLTSNVCICIQYHAAGAVRCCGHRCRQSSLCSNQRPDEPLHEDPVHSTLSMLKQSNFSSSRLPPSARCPPLPSCLTQPRAMTLDWEGSSETAVWAPRISTQSKVSNIKLLSYYTTPTRREKITCCLKQAFLVFLQLTYVLCANLR